MGKFQKSMERLWEAEMDHPRPNKRGHLPRSQNKHQQQRLHRDDNLPKTTNLLLYIPSLLAHPDGCLKETIFWNAICYWNQNRPITNFTRLTADFALHLKKRGHGMNEIETRMLEAAKGIDSGDK
jgi:hypothetical protein